MALSKIQNNSFEDAAVHGRRNIVINGAMQVAQRGTSVTGITSDSYHTVDRFKGGPSNMGTFTHSQESDGPAGFTKSVKLECTVADASPAAGDTCTISQRVEAQNLQHLAKGTSEAKSVTVSFWCKSNKTGTYTLEIFDADNSRHISATYTVNSSATWEYKTITFVGDATGSLNNDNGIGFYLLWWLGAGSTFTGGTLGTSWQAQDNADRVSSSNVNLADTVGNYFQLTGVQFEVGDTATPFEHRSFGEELALCQRYYEKSYDVGTAPGGAVNSSGPYMSITSDSGSNATFTLPYIVAKRTTPTCAFYRDDGTSGGWQYYRAGVGSTNSAVTKHRGSQNALNGYIGVGATFVPVTVYGHWTADAEL
jgi:hypothetical protein